MLNVNPDQPLRLAVVVDTEEEFDWSAPFDRQAVSVENIRHQTLAQRVFDRYGIVPAYVIDHPVATSDMAVSVLRAMAEAGRCEIGAHLHPWVNPPHAEDVADPRNSFPGNLPAELEGQKLAVLTETIARRFGLRPDLYKAGRHGIGPNTWGHLARLGYHMDVSTVPYTDFSPKGGPDFSAFRDEPFLTPQRIQAWPVTVGFTGKMRRWGYTLYPRLARAEGLRLPGLAARLGLLERVRLSPEGHRLEELKRLVRARLAAGQRLFMLTYHSSSLLPGGSPYARDVAERDALVRRIEAFSTFFMEECGGRGMAVSELRGMLAVTEPPSPPRRAV